MNEYRKCTLCPRNCGIDRTKITGICGSDEKCRIVRAALHYWEEPCISGESGSGTVFFSGCNMKCVFCQNYDISTLNKGYNITVEKLSDIFLKLQYKGANNINLVTPTHYLPHIVQRHYIKKVCIIGTESCGKTTLIKNLAMYFNTTYVEEAGKYVCIDAGGIDNMQKKHYFDILFKQKELEYNALENANKILLIDTDALITLFYFNLGFNDSEIKNNYFKNIAENICKLNSYDLYIFLEPDVNFVYDMTRREVDDSVRNENNIKLKQLFDNIGIKYITINGSYDERYEKSKEKVLKLIKE